MIVINTFHCHRIWLWHIISLSLFVHSLVNSISANFHRTSPVIPISFSANDYRSGNWSIDNGEEWDNVTCPVEYHCSLMLSPMIGEYLKTANGSSVGLSSVSRSLPIDTETLILNNNTIEELHDQFVHLDHLLQLDLSNNYLTNLGRGHVFHNLSHLRTLNLSGNKFKTIFGGVFHGLKRLEILIMSECQIKHINEHAFDGLEVLNQLIMDNNQISSVYLELFQSISNLHVLNFAKNNIQHLTGGIFASLNSLRRLNLSFNHLLTINDNAFVGLDMIEELYLQGNRLWHVPSIALQSLKRIAYLNIGYNHFSQINTGDFVHTPANHIYVNGCPQLILVDRGAFWDLPNIHDIHLDNNPRLEFIDPQAFLGVPTLREITLHNNSLFAIQSDIIDNIVIMQKTSHVHGNDHHQRRTIHVTLEGNPFLCDCNIHYLYQCLHNQSNCLISIPNSEQLICTEPEELLGIRIIDLNITDVPEKCAPKLVAMMNVNMTIHKKIGDRHTFQCRSLGIPQPKIHWILPNNEVINETSNMLHFQLKNPGSLRMFHLKPRDSGTYKCIAENGNGKAQYSTDLSVDNIDIHLFPVIVSSTFVTLVWNGTARNSFHEYQILYKPEDSPSLESKVTPSVFTTKHSNNGHRYETVTVSHFMRSYTISHLLPQKRYRICIAIRDDETKLGYVQLSCCSVTTRSADFLMKHMTSKTSNYAISIVIMITIVMTFVLYFSIKAALKYRKQMHYESPEKTIKTENSVSQIPMENIYTPLIANLDK